MHSQHTHAHALRACITRSALHACCNELRACFHICRLRKTKKEHEFSAVPYSSTMKTLHVHALRVARRILALNEKKEISSIWN